MGGSAVPTISGYFPPARWQVFAGDIVSPSPFSNIASIGTPRFTSRVNSKRSKFHSPLFSAGLVREHFERRGRACSGGLEPESAMGTQVGYLLILKDISASFRTLPDASPFPPDTRPLATAVRVAGACAAPQAVSSPVPFQLNRPSPVPNLIRGVVVSP